MFSITSDHCDIRRKLRVYEHAEKIDDVSKTYRHFGIGPAAFYRWRKAYCEEGEAGLVNDRSLLPRPSSKTSPEITEKILHLRQTLTKNGGITMSPRANASDLVD